MTKKVWRRYNHKTGECIQTARIRLLGIGKYAFETSLFGNPWEQNVNMPMFATEEDAIGWIQKTGKWWPGEEKTEPPRPGAIGPETGEMDPNGDEGATHE